MLTCNFFSRWKWLKKLSSNFFMLHLIDPCFYLCSPAIHGFLLFKVDMSFEAKELRADEPTGKYRSCAGLPCLTKKSNNRKLFNILSNPHQHLIRMPWILIGSSYRSTKTSNKKHPKVLSLTPWFQCLEYPEFPSRLKSKTTSHLLPILRGQSLLLLQLLGCPMRTAGWMRTRPLVGSSLYCNLYQWSFLVPLIGGISSI